LKGIERSQLKSITSNPFVLTSPFKEIIEDHPAIDFSFYQKWEYTTFQDFPIQSILPGKVVLVEDNRFPYGYMVLIETPLSQIDPVILTQIPQPTLVPSGYTPEQRCPVVGNPVTFDSSSQSIYALYAHFSSLPLVKIGDSVSCGDLIGYAGSTGNSAEPHLHLEIRFGPSDAKFESIANYHSSVTLEERYDYCIWTISGIFQAVDPAKLLYQE
jgi:murein DD-endopeptidase MepM/ murein hydrolase activator NlpD